MVIKQTSDPESVKRYREIQDCVPGYLIPIKGPTRAVTGVVQMIYWHHIIVLDIVHSGYYEALRDIPATN